MSLTTRLSLRETPFDVRLGCRQVVRLGQHDAVENSIEPPIAASVQAMAHKSSGGRLQRRHASVGRQLCVSREPVSGSENGRQGPGGDKVDTTDVGQGRKAPRGEIPNLLSQLLGLRQRQSKAQSKPPYRRGSLGLDGVAAGSSVALEDIERCLGLEIG